MLIPLLRFTFLGMSKPTNRAGIFPGIPFVCGLAILFTATPLKAGAVLDQIQFGNPVSETQHKAKTAGTIEEAGGMEESCRRLQSDGALEFDLKCEAGRQNYLTVKFWGGDADVATIYLFDGDKSIGNYGEEKPELDSDQGGVVLPGRFYYVTYPIPREMTDGKDHVRLKLGAKGALSPYAAKP